MNPTHAAEIRAWMRTQGFEPSKSLGQNFLVDVHQRDFIVETAAVTADDHVLEVGPGLGVLTEPLAERGCALTLIELDRRLAARLQQRFAGNSRIRVIEGDAVRVDLAGLLAGGVNRVVANLPYSVGSRVLYDLAAAPCRPASITVTVQREVAERLAAPVDGEDYGLLSVWMQMFYTVRIARVLPPGCFLPPPRVESAVVDLRRREVPLSGTAPLDRLAGVIKRAFEQRRKQLGTTFRKAPEPWRLAPEALQAAGLDPRRRPETLAPAEFARLASLYPPGPSASPGV